VPEFDPSREAEETRTTKAVVRATRYSQAAGVVTVSALVPMGFSRLDDLMANSMGD
jgi:hypothetical protein